MDIDLEHARGVAVEAAEAAGALLRNRIRRPGRTRAKGEGDVVTELDLLSEDIIVGRLKAAFPGHRILSEEGTPIGDDAACTWVVDPLDGTNNLVIGLAVCGIGIALCDAGVPVLGVVHDPVAGCTWSAVRGRGAWERPGLRLRRRTRSTARRPVLAWTQGYTVRPDDRTAGALRLLLGHEAGRVLELWAPLLCWVMLARGDIDGLVGYRIGEVDLHAGALIATEAGIDIRSLSGGPYVDRLTGLAETRSLVAGPPDMTNRLMALWPAAERIRGRFARLCSGAEAPQADDGRRSGTSVAARPSVLGGITPATEGTPGEDGRADSRGRPGTPAASPDADR